MDRDRIASCPPDGQFRRSARFAPDRATCRKGEDECRVYHKGRAICPSNVGGLPCSFLSNRASRAAHRKRFGSRSAANPPRSARSRGSAARSNRTAFPETIAGIEVVLRHGSVRRLISRPFGYGRVDNPNRRNRNRNRSVQAFFETLSDLVCAKGPLQRSCFAAYNCVPPDPSHWLVHADDRRWPNVASEGPTTAQHL